MKVRTGADRLCVRQRESSVSSVKQLYFIWPPGVKEKTLNTYSLILCTCHQTCLHASSHSGLAVEISIATQRKPVQWKAVLCEGHLCRVLYYVLCTVPGWLPQKFLHFRVFHLVLQESWKPVAAQTVHASWLHLGGVWRSTVWSTALPSSAFMHSSWGNTHIFLFCGHITMLYLSINTTITPNCGSSYSL